MEYNASEAHVAVKDLYSSLNSDRLPTLIRACGDDSNILATNNTLYLVGAYNCRTCLATPLHPS